ncbi:isoflavone reductase [Neurospora intermedia]|uniref:Isoflavone reductase n=1 Tax=Neurospora intermedia TaxID=5142 RepID=A0ABR3D283_NEUIN
MRFNSSPLHILAKFQELYVENRTPSPCPACAHIGGLLLTPFCPDCPRLLSREIRPLGRARRLFKLPKRGVSAVAHYSGQLSRAEEGQAAVLPCDDMGSSTILGMIRYAANRSQTASKGKAFWWRNPVCDAVGLSLPSSIFTFSQHPAAMMRIAIAGGGSFAYILVQEISKSAHPPHPELEENLPSCQLALVDFQNVDDLHYVLRGVDLLISTISNNEQLNLIDAARRARVRCFVPSEFEGPLSQRPPANGVDPLDNRGSRAALDLLESWSQSRSHWMNYTVFSCGIFMERFARGGLQPWGIGTQLGLMGSMPTSGYLVNIEQGTAEVVERDSQGRTVYVAMTSMYDVARFVAAAVELTGVGALGLPLERWPREWRVRGDCMAVGEVVRVCEAVRGVQFSVTRRSYQEAEAWANECQRAGNVATYLYYQRLLQTANGRYCIRSTNLGELVNQRERTAFQPMRFRTWLEQVWGPVL